ncbi:MAG: ribosome small subunit-dependent GTPase A [Pseudomonadaceae bacterium]|nr:ribosome small subunit-dependent GTPase A [Pseudomonadaceae bacterium]
MSSSTMDELLSIGWKPFFQQQMLQLDEHLQPARVIAVQRTGLTVAPAVGTHTFVSVSGRFFIQDPVQRPTVGDWIAINPDTGSLEVLLERLSLIKRLSPGTSGEIQLIAANIDTAFLVTSCNADFNLARLERYLSVVMEADIQPVIVLTKMDMTDNVDYFRDEARKLGAHLAIETVNALDADSLQGLLGWCGTGQSIALLGSSGVGKSTLVNTLAGTELQITKSAREDDDKGRHTTTHRSLHKLPSGGVILDSPGMREFQLADAEQGLGSLFADIETLSEQCKFNDCKHSAEPGCAVQQAIENGDLEQRRLDSYFKLQREDLYNRETLAERRARYRQFAKTVKHATSQADKKRS